jgi:hypothetical protein
MTPDEPNGRTRMHTNTGESGETENVERKAELKNQIDDRLRNT